MATADEHDVEQVPFGAWLVKQTQRGGFVGELANSAAKDRAFPRNGDVDAARKWLQASRASGDDWEALEDAESAWLAS
jgi:hypothetical protein